MLREEHGSVNSRPPPLVIFDRKTNQPTGRVTPLINFKKDTQCRHIKTLKDWSENIMHFFWRRDELWQLVVKSNSLGVVRNVEKNIHSYILHTYYFHIFLQ